MSAATVAPASATARSPRAKGLPARIAPPPLIPVVVLTGFLGSGKTTLRNRLLPQPAFERTLVLINEFGSVSIDHDLVVASRDETVIELPNGCICCSLRGDLVRTLHDAVGRFAREGRPWFDRVVIETTGLADPTPILGTLMTHGALLDRFRLQAVLTTVDAVNGDGTLDAHDVALRQVAVADLVLVTKQDLAPTADAQRLHARLATINPGARRLDVAHGALDAAEVLDTGLIDGRNDRLRVEQWLNVGVFVPVVEPARAALHQGVLLCPPGFQHGVADRALHGHGHVHADIDPTVHDGVRSTCLVLDEPVRAEAVDRWFDALLALRGRDFLRVKGIVNVVELPVPMLIQGVQHVMHPPLLLDAWPSDDRRTRIVFITRNIEDSVLRDSLPAFDAAVARVERARALDGLPRACSPMRTTTATGRTTTASRHSVPREHNRTQEDRPWP